jgi:hypothetical protein
LTYSRSSGILRIVSVPKRYDLHAEYLTPPEVAAVLPGATAVSVRRWAENGQLPGAIQLPSGRWQIPWSAVVSILGFDPRADATAAADADPVDGDRGDPLPGFGE